MALYGAGSSLLLNLDILILTNQPHTNPSSDDVLSDVVLIRLYAHLVRMTKYVHSSHGPVMNARKQYALPLQSIPLLLAIPRAIPRDPV